MYTPKEKSPGADKAGDQSRPNKGAAKEDVQQIEPEDVIKAPFAPAKARDDAKTPLHAAKGNDEVMSQPPRKGS